MHGNKIFHTNASSEKHSFILFNRKGPAAGFTISGACGWQYSTIGKEVLILVEHNLRQYLQWQRKQMLLFIHIYFRIFTSKQ
jgi:hypothetical protein